MHSVLGPTDALRVSPAPYGFAVFKPSTLWPPPPPEFRKRAAESTSLHGLKEAAQRIQQNGKAGSTTPKGSGSHFPHLHDPLLHHKQQALADAIQRVPEHDNPAADSAAGGAGIQGDKADSGQHKAEVAEVIRVKVDGKEVELADQIQLYATNAQVGALIALLASATSDSSLTSLYAFQLIYPFVSPVWQPSLGGLPPLYIMGGDKEVLRDEIIYVRCCDHGSMSRNMDSRSKRTVGAPGCASRPIPRPRWHPAAKSPEDRARKALPAHEGSLWTAPSLRRDRCG